MAGGALSSARFFVDDIPPAPLQRITPLTFLKYKDNNNYDASDIFSVSSQYDLVRSA